MSAESVEVSAKTVNEAIAQALAKLGASRDEVEVTVLNEGRSGILGFGAEEARVRVQRRVVAVPVPAAESAPSAPAPVPAEAAAFSVDEEVEVGREILAELLDRLGIEARIDVRQSSGLVSLGEPRAPALDVTDGDLGILIGRRGETLSSLQFIVNLIASKRLGHHTSLVVDVEGYRVRREESLRSLAERMADRVKQSGEPIALEAMPPAERRIIHLALQDDPAVTTASVGEEDHRKVVISPKKGS